ncbi:hypothetical protein ACQCVK_10625 [Rossellomorea vietnamensis]|uniref:hypothetical protein n=1 Tax=Rossellomorea vietnamensis TaxID=218284 RepID=UPI003CE78391
MVQFTDSERHIVTLFNPGARFHYQGREYEVIISGKPITNKGEPKTDIYVKCREVNGSDELEFKISFKQDNADFLENKMTDERAEQIFGPNWQSIISDFTKQIEGQFRSRPYIYKSKFRKTQAGSITLGWRFELLNKPGGDLSDIVNLTPEQVVEVYAGRKLSLSKKNATVNGRIIPDSGVANCVINCDATSVSNIQQAVDNIIHIEEFAKQNPNVYFACKALNYRSFYEKIEGNRHLSVFIDWTVVHGKLHPNVTFDNPLVTRGRYVADRLVNSLGQLRINNTDDINENNITSLSYLHL